jgi:hypothetical protein
MLCCVHKLKEFAVQKATSRRLSAHRMIYWSKENKMRDKIIEEIRKIRDEYAESFNYDLQAIYLDLRRGQQLRGAKIVSFAQKTTHPETITLSVKSDSEKH